MANNNNIKNLNVPPLRFPGFTGEWEECTISDFGTVITGNTPPTKDISSYENGKRLWASPADLGKSKWVYTTQTKLSQIGFEKTRKLPKGAILITCIGSTIGKMGMAVDEMSTNQQINSIITNPFNDNDFVYYAIESRFPKYLTSITVQAVPIISKSLFEKLPNNKTGLEEQYRIGKLLSLIDKRIEAQCKIIDQYESLIKGIVNLLFEAKEKNIPLKDCVICHSSTLTETEVLEKTGAYPVYGASGIIAHFSNYNISENSILIIKDESNVGKLQYASGKYSVIGTLNYLTAKNNIYLKYIYYCMQNLNLGIYKVGSGIPHIYFKDYGNELIYCPNFTEQEKIANVLSMIDHKILIEKKLLNNYMNQKKHLLSNLFI